MVKGIALFLLKKIITGLFMPLPFCLLLIGGGLALLWFTRRQRAGRVMVTAGAVLLTLASYGVVTEGLLRPLEREVAPLALNEESAASVEWIVVLSGGVASDPEVPAASRLTNASLARVVEGVRLRRELPNAKLLLTGGSVFGSITEAEAMRAVVESLGAGGAGVVLETESRDTDDQARIVRRIVGDDRFILVTSASHMPRSLALFDKAGMRPIPSPVGYRALDDHVTDPREFYPNSGAISNVEVAIHEYLGRVWSRLRGRG